ncbi:hypothetical protein KGM_213766 [Danaus plexippus plexippus]|uniref:BZIP domain-containing protein n=1 Tax=Danaus plexippus plexippus TaxID=278856 RepID=A0A212EXI5_DANPL|nr:hypothetical protein KGM_213766 [Danaus plexippus plexippus]
MNIDFEAMAVLEEESQNDCEGRYRAESLIVQEQRIFIFRANNAFQESLGVFGSSGAGVVTGERRESGKRGRRPGRKAQLDKQDMKAKLERSRQSARECRARKKLRYQYLEELVADRERSVLALRKELDKYYKWNLELDQGRMPEGLDQLLQEMGVVKEEVKI